MVHYSINHECGIYASSALIAPIKSTLPSEQGSIKGVIEILDN